METTLTPPRSMKTFLVIWLGQLISIVGSGLTSFALGVWIFDQTRQATPFALTVLFGNLPRILLAPLAGSLADRWNRRRVMILADSGNALVTGVVVLLLMAGSLQVWHIYLIALLGASFQAFQEPAYTASIAMLVAKKDLGRANGLVSMSQALEMLVSPLLAGLLFVTIGLHGVILIDFASFFFAVGALLLVRIPQPAIAIENDGRKASIRMDALFGWRYLRERRGLFGLLVYFAMVNYFLNFAGVLTGPLVLSFSAASNLGAVQMAAGAGMLVGSLLMSAWGGPHKRVQAVIGFIALAGLGLSVAGLQPNLFTIGSGLFLLLFCVPLASGNSQAIFQSKVAPEVQGRVFAVRTMISHSMMPLAFLSAGALADRVFEPWMRPGGSLAGSALADILGTGAGRGAGLMFVLAGLAMITASILAFSSRSIRQVQEDLPDSLPEREPELAASMD